MQVLKQHCLLIRQVRYKIPLASLSFWCVLYDCHLVLLLCIVRCTLELRNSVGLRILLMFLSTDKFFSFNWRRCSLNSAIVIVPMSFMLPPNKRTPQTRRSDWGVLAKGRSWRTDLCSIRKECCHHPQ